MLSAPLKPLSTKTPNPASIPAPCLTNSASGLAALKRFGSSKSGKASSTDVVEIESSSSRLEGEVPTVASSFGRVEEGWSRTILRFKCNAESGLAVAITASVSKFVVFAVVAVNGITAWVISRRPEELRGAAVTET